MDSKTFEKLLKGKKVVQAAVIDDVPMIMLNDGTIIEAWRDAEGNGPGHLEIYNRKLVFRGQKARKEVHYGR